MTERMELARRRSRLSPAKQARLAEWITGQGGRRSIPRRRDPGPAPLSFAQERLWFIEQLLPGTRAYELPTALTLTGPLDPDPLRRALIEIVRRHEVLRTRFPAPGGRAVAVVDRPWPLTLVNHANDEPGFDLAAGQLIRAALIRTGPDTHQLRLVTHHIISDAWSQRLLVRELTALYEAFAAGRPSPLAELPVQYADFAVWQRDQLAGSAMTSELAYWRDRLAGPPPVLDLPTDRPRPAVPTYGGATHRRPLPAPLLATLRDLAQRTSTTLYMVVLAGLVVLLHRCTGEADITVGTPVAGRGHPDVDGLIGFFANPVVLRTNVADDPTVLELLRRVRESAVAAFSHADVPFAQVVDALRPPRRLSHTALFQVQLIVQDAPPPVSLADGLTVDVATLDARGAQFDLTVVLSRDVCRIDYSTDLFDPATVAGLAGHLETLLGGLVADPGRRLSALPVPGLEVARRPARQSTVDESRPPAPYRAPRTALERTIAGIWGEVLGVRRVGLDDSFFDLGGHSVLLIQVHSRVCAELGRPLDVIDVFAHPTVGALANHFSAPDEPDAGRSSRPRQAADARRAALARLTGNPGGSDGG